jgi:hypothetical protein
MDFVLKYVVARLKERSTWAGLVLAIVGAAGWKLTAGQTEAITSAGLALVGLISTFLPDKFGE